MRWWPLVVALAVPDCVCHRDVVIRPALTIHVVDASGAPVPHATVMIMHQMQPYSALSDWWPLETDEHGVATTTELTRDEEVAYFCMHGVRGHDYFACAGRAGAGVAIEWVHDDTITLRLHDDYQDDCWNAHAYAAGGDLSWSLQGKYLPDIRAHVERLPAEGRFPR